MNGVTKIGMLALSVALGFGAGKLARPSGDVVTPAAITDRTPKEPLSALPKAMRDSGLKSWDELLRLDHAPLTTSDWHRLMGSSQGDPYLTESLVRRWATVDPEACWAYLIERGDSWPDFDLARMIISEWGGRDPQAAIAALAALDPPNKELRSERGRLVESAMVAAMILDLDRGFELLPTASALGTNLMFSEEWMIANPGKVCRQLESYLMKHPGNFTRTAGIAAAAWYKQMPLAALEWAKTQPHATRVQAYRKISEVMAEAGDFKAIEKLVREVDSMSILQGGGRPLRKQLQRKDPALACQWVIDTFDGPMMGAEISNIISTTSAEQFDPAGFAPYFEQIPGGFEKGEAARSLFLEWAKADFPAAAAWMSRLDQRTRNESAGSVASQWSATPAAHQWLRSAPPSEFADTLLRSALRKLGDPAKAREFAATLPPARASMAEEIVGRRQSN